MAEVQGIILDQDGREGTYQNSKFYNKETPLKPKGGLFRATK